MYADIPTHTTSYQGEGVYYSVVNNSMVLFITVCYIYRQILYHYDVILQTQGYVFNNFPDHDEGQFY